MRHQKVCGLQNECLVERPDELHVPRALVVKPERPENQGGRVFLDGQHLLPVPQPLVPVAGQRSIRVVVLKEVSLLGQRPAAELEELPAQLRVAGLLERRGGECPVAAPHVGVRISPETLDVRVVRGDDRPSVVDLGSQDEKTAIEDVRNRTRQISKGSRFLSDPCLPVVRRSADQPGGCLLANDPIDVDHFFVALACSQPVEGRARSSGRDVHPNADCRLRASPGDWAPAEFSVFGLLPGWLSSGPFLDTAREVIGHRLFGIAAIDEEVPIPLVVDDGPGVRIVVRRVPDFGAVEVRVLVEEELDLARSPFQVDDLNSPDVDVEMAIDGVLTAKFQRQRAVPESHLRDERVVAIPEIRFPLWAHPGDAAVCPDSEAKFVPPGVVLQADPGEEDVPNAVARIEVYEEIAVAYRNVSGHGFPTRR